MLVPDDVGLPVGEFDAVTLELNDIEGVPLAGTTKLGELVDVAVTVVERLSVNDPVSLPLSLPEGVCELVGVPLIDNV